MGLNHKMVVIPCSISHAPFLGIGGYLFRLEPSGKLGFANERYCYDSQRKHLEGEPRPQGWVPGYVLGITVAPSRNDGTIWVELPDKEMYEISEDQLIPAKGFAHVPDEP